MKIGDNFTLLNNMKDIYVVTDNSATTNPQRQIEIFKQKDNNINKPISNKSQNPITNELINITNSKGFFSSDLSNLEAIIYNQLNENNIIEVLMDYQTLNKKNLLEEICNLKCASNNTRRLLILDLVDKLEKANEDANREIQPLINNLRSEINYQFKKIGFTDTKCMSSMFEALVEKIQNKPKQINYKKRTDFEKEFSTEELVPKSNKQEYIGKLHLKDENGISRDIIIGKDVHYDIGNGRKLIEVYHYDNSKKDFVLYSKSIHMGEKVIKSATYRPDGHIAYVYHQNNEGHEIYRFRANGTIYQQEITTNKNAQYFTFGKNGNLAIIENCVRDTDGHYDEEKTDMKFFDREGRSMTTFGSYWTFDCEGDNNEIIEKNILKKIWSLSKDNLNMNIITEYPTWTIICDYGERYAAKILSYIKDICMDLAQERNIDINDLYNQFLVLIHKNDKENIEKAGSVVLQMLARVTNKYDYVDEENYQNYAPANGKLDKDFSQGHFGTCWLTCSIKSLTMTPGGQKLLKEIVKKDPITNEITVTLKGAPEGQQTYRYTQEQINQASELSTGEGDARAIEMAVRDHFLAHAKKGEPYDINGNDLAKALELLSGKKGKEQFYYSTFWQDSITSDQRTELINYLKSIANKGNIIGNCAFAYNNEWQGIYTGHAYTLYKVDNKFVYVVNPWDTSREIKIPIDEFTANCHYIYTIDLE